MIRGGICDEHGHAPNDWCLPCAMLREQDVGTEIERRLREAAPECGGAIMRGLAFGSIELLEDEGDDVVAIPSDAEADLNALADYGRAGAMEL